METTALSLKQQWAELKKDQPNVRIRNAAKIIGCSEVELLATHCGDTVIRLENQFKEILERIHELGYVMALTRNDDVVHERKGTYQNWTYGPHASLFVGPDIDLRIFLSQWKSAFAVTEGEGEKRRYSIQFFDKSGTAVHKIYLTKESDFSFYEKVTSDFKSENQSKEEEVQPAEENHTEMPDNMIDVMNFQKEWLELRDTHDFYMLLKKYRLSRKQALRLAPEGNYAVKVDNQFTRALFNKMVEKQIPIMVFVGNKGMIQIHTGEINNLLDRHGWFNVIDPEFNLHLKEDAIDESWVVRKPTEDGIVTGLELFDKNGNQIATIFGKRKPGIPELNEWRHEVATLESEMKI